MKRRKPPVPPEPITMESKIALIKSVLDKYLDPVLLRKHGYAPYDPAVKWSFSLTNTDQMNDQYELIFTIRHGAFRENTHQTVRKWWRLEYVEQEEVVNALFHALTWEGSPYWFDDGRWRKHMEVM